MSREFVAGKLFRGGAVGTAIRAWYEAGAKPHCWQKARQVLAELFPEARPNSREAIIRLAQGAVACSRMMSKRGPDWIPTDAHVPDARRLIRDAHRE